MITAPVYDWLNLLLVGGVAGLVGQGARAVVGLKKLNDYAADVDASFASLMDLSRLFISLAIGFVAGVISAFAAATAATNITATTHDQILSFMVAGYIGTDFIEAFLNRTVAPAAAQAAAAAKAAASTDTFVG